MIKPVWNFPSLSLLRLTVNPRWCDTAQPVMTFNAEAMAQLEGMGFPTVRCQKALLATGNSDANTAMEWLFMHMDDAGS